MGFLMPFGDTIVALATPVGESAVALIRLSGPLCPEIALHAFQRQRPARARHAYVGKYKTLSDNILDECVYTLFAANGSYTGEDILEISTHGNPLIAQHMIEDLLQRGCRMAEAGEFTRTAFTNGKLDLSQAEAVSDLIRARSDKAIRSAQQQLAGAIGKKMCELTDRLLQVIAEVEAYIDFPEEDLPAENQAGPAQSLAHISAELRELIETSHYSAILKEGIKTVIVGPPNAGKSSLLNTLTGQDRAIVSAEPGTTRDFLSEKIIVGPYCIQIMDTAGIHEATSSLERLGIAKTLEKLEEADFFLVVLDSTLPPPTLPDNALRCFQANCTLVIENKIDLHESQSLNSVLPECPRVRISLKTGAGIDALRTTLIKTLETDKVVPNENALIVSARHANALRSAKDSIDTAREKMTAAGTTELMASDLRLAVEAIGEVVGKIDNERMLDKLFASFCIGK